MMLLDSTDGSELVWSKGDAAGGGLRICMASPPVQPDRLRLFAIRAAAQMNTVAVHDGGCAFEELHTIADSTAGWRLRLVTAKGSAPVVVDSNANRCAGSSCSRDVAGPHRWPDHVERNARIGRPRGLGAPERRLQEKDDQDSDPGLKYQD